MPPATTEMIENKSLMLIDGCNLDKTTDESSLLPGLQLDRGKWQEGREPSSHRDEDLTTKRSKAFNQGSETSFPFSPEIPFESPDDGSAPVASLSLIGQMMSRPEVEVTNLSNGDCVDDTIVLSSSVLEILDGMDGDDSILPGDDPRFTISPVMDGSLRKSAFSAVISTIKSAAASILPAANGNKSSEINHDGPMKAKTAVKCMTLAACVLKTTKETKTGISINQRGGNRTKVSKIVEGGLFDLAGLKVGDEIVSVNNIKTEGKTSREITTMIGDMAGTVTILARRKLKEDKQALSPKNVVVEADKAHNALGIEVKKTERKLNTPHQTGNFLLKKPSKSISKPPHTKQEHTVGSSDMVGELSEDHASKKKVEGIGSRKKPSRSIRKPHKTKQGSISGACAMVGDLSEDHAPKITRADVFNSHIQKKTSSARKRVFNSFRNNPRPTDLEPGFPSERTSPPQGTHFHKSARNKSKGQPQSLFTPSVFSPQEMVYYDKVVDYGFVESELAFQESSKDAFSHYEVLSVDEASDMSSLSSGSMLTLAEFLGANDMFCCQLYAECRYLLYGVGDKDHSHCSV